MRAQGMIDVAVDTVEADTAEVRTLGLRPLEGGVFPCPPGGHIDLHLQNGIVRSYSLINRQHETGLYRIAVKREPEGRGGSSAVHRLELGERLLIGQPRTNFPLATEAPAAVFIAGGIGVTPFVSLAEQADGAGQEWVLHHICRSSAEAPLGRLVGEIAAQARHGRIVVHGTRELHRRPSIGAIVAAAPDGAHLYCCGPQTMLDDFRAATISLDSARCHVESFSGSAEATQETAFTVQLVRSGLEFEIPPGKTILDVLLDAGLDVAHSCCQGFCGSCETVVVAGIPDHRDVFLSESQQAANDRMMICCSGSKSQKLILDL
jgi:vanillate O-demethylase ferredoxin subunit